MKIFKVFHILIAAAIFTSSCNPYKIDIPHWDYEDKDNTEIPSAVVYPESGGKKEQTLQTTGVFRETVISKGLVHYHFSGTDEVTGAAQNVNVLEVDLDNEDYKVTFTYVNPRDTVSSVAKKNGALAAINGAYELEAVYCRVNGFNISEVTLAPGHLRFWKHNAAVVCDGGRKVGIINGGSDGTKSIELYKSLPEKNIYASAPMLIDDFKPVGESFVPSYLTPSDLSQLDGEDYRRHQGVRHPRTAVALTADNDLLLIIVDGRAKGKAEGMSAKELTKFIAKHFNPRWAINMDGGGSSTMYIKGYGSEVNNVLNYPTDNDRYDHFGQRLLSTHILIQSTK